MQFRSFPDVVGFSGQDNDRDFSRELVRGAVSLGRLHPLCCYYRSFCCFRSTTVSVDGCDAEGFLDKCIERCALAPSLVGSVGGVSEVCQVMTGNALHWCLYCI